VRDDKDERLIQVGRFKGKGTCLGQRHLLARCAIDDNGKRLAKADHVPDKPKTTKTKHNSTPRPSQPLIHKRQPLAAAGGCDFGWEPGEAQPGGALCM
jgi:hypothetical protein